MTDPESLLDDCCVSEAEGFLAVSRQDSGSNDSLSNVTFLCLTFSSHFIRFLPLFDCSDDQPAAFPR